MLCGDLNGPKGRGWYVYVWLMHSAVQWKLIHSVKTTVLQWKLIKKKHNRPSSESVRKMRKTMRTEGNGRVIQRGQKRPSQRKATQTRCESRKGTSLWKVWAACQAEGAALWRSQGGKELWVPETQEEGRERWDRSGPGAERSHRTVPPRGWQSPHHRVLTLSPRGLRIPRDLTPFLQEMKIKMSFLWVFFRI